jgi:myo-inositol-1(or 4)-monophosphatase
MDQQYILDTAIEAARAAGALALEHRSHPLIVMQKGYRDFVTEADIAAQTLIIEMVRNRFPAHGIVGEEEGGEVVSAESTTRWIIDPIDGTSNYEFGIPAWCVSIGVAQGDQPQVGVIYDPLHDELFTAMAGKGSFLNGNPLTTNKTTQLNDAIVSLDWGRSADMRQSALAILNRLAPEVRSIRAVGSAALAVAWIAAGRLESYFNLGLKIWDVAAASLILHEAGGRFSSFDDHPFTLSNQKTWQLASNGTVHKSIINLLETETE